MRILISTGVYPPAHGGPGYYAKSLKDEFERLGHEVVVKTYTIEHVLPIGIRHLFYFFKTLPAYIRADWTLVLDTFSVGFPVACMKRLCGGKTILRTGGDFLWEHYVERTKEKILLSKFYDEPRQFTFKERLILRLTRFTLRMMSCVVFSTRYQREIWMKPYELDVDRVRIVENRYGAATEKGTGSDVKHFVYCASRDLFWKNTDVVREAFVRAQQSVPGITLDFLHDLPREDAIEKIKKAYACILVSLGDISPNYVLRALSYGKPVILTSENGLTDRIGDTVMYADPLDVDVIAHAIVEMCNEKTHALYQDRAVAFSFTHSYATIAQELLKLAA